MDDSKRTDSDDLRSGPVAAEVAALRQVLCYWLPILFVALVGIAAEVAHVGGGGFGIGAALAFAAAAGMANRLKS